MPQHFSFLEYKQRKLTAGLLAPPRPGRVKQGNLKTIHGKAVNLGIDFMQYFGRKLEMDQTEI